MLKKDEEKLFFDSPSFFSRGNRDEIITYKSRKKSADNSFQVDRIMKASRPSDYSSQALLNGVSYFLKKGFFEQSILAIAGRNNCPKVNIPTYTIFYCMNLRQTQKDPKKDIYNYVEMKILAQVSKIKNASEEELEQAERNQQYSDFLYRTYPVYEGSKLIDVHKHVSMITVLGDPNAIFFDNAFSSVDENKPLWSGQKWKEMSNPFICAAPSFMKRPIKEPLHNSNDRSRIYCYAPQLCDRAEIANRSPNKPYVPFIQIDERSFGESFDPTDLLSVATAKKLLARNAVRAMAHMIYSDNKSKIQQNLKTVAKKLPSDREFMFCGKKLNDYSDCRIILE